MSEFFNKKEEEEIRKSGGNARQDGGTFSDEEIERAGVLLGQIAKNEKDGFFFVISKTKIEGGVNLEGVAKVTNANKREMLDSVLKSLRMDDGAVLQFLRSRLEDRLSEQE